MATFSISADPVSPVAAAGRRAWAALEPMHNLLYFDPIAQAHYATLGILDRRLSYYAARACALGKVPAEVVVAAFYNFNPQTITDSVRRVWAIAEPADMLAARFEAADLCLRPLLRDAIGSTELAEALDLARRAALAAAELTPGRPLFAAHAAQPWPDWPDRPHVQLWWAQTLLREFRGDGHQATLLSSGVSGVEALVLYVATEKVDGAALRLTRGWSGADWRATVSSLQAQGLLEVGPELEVTERGRALRQFLENQTDQLAQAPYAAIGEAGANRLAELAERLNQPVIAADLIPWLKKPVPGSRRRRVAQVRAV